MPAIELISVPLYQSDSPYVAEIDNIPIQGIINQIVAVNNQTDNNSVILTDSIGSQGTLANRLAQSLNDDGSLKTTAINTALHNIAYHVDGSVTVDGIPVSYVRMKNEERAKLSGVASGATNLKVLVDVENTSISGAPSNLCVISSSEIEFFQDIMHIKPSDSITWRVDATGAIVAETTFPAAARHQHFYDYTPAHQTPSTPNYQSYKVTSVGTPYKEQTLRVYVNGTRLSASDTTYYPSGISTGSVTWRALKYTEDTAISGVITSGKFTLSSAITSVDVIRVDFDALYT